MPSQTVDFLYKVDAALAGLYVSLVSNVDGVTKYSATTTSDVNGKWAINPKPPAGTYALYTGNAQGVLTTLVDPDFVVDPFNDDGTAVFPKQVTVSAGGLVVTAGGMSIMAGNVGIGQAAAANVGLLLGSVSVVASGGFGHLLYLQDQLSASANNDSLRGQSIANLNFSVGAFTGTSAAGISIDGAGWTKSGAAAVATAYGLVVSAPTFATTNYAFFVSSGATLLQATTIVAGGLTINAGGLTVVAGGANITGTLTLSSAPGLLSMQGAGTASILGGTTGFQIVNNANAAINLGITDGGDVSIRGKFDINAAGQLQIGAVNASSIAMRGPQKALIVGQFATAFAAGAQTMTAAIMLGGLIEGTPTAGAAYTFDTGTLLDAAIPNVASGDTFVFAIANRAGGAFNITLTAAAGITILGNGVIPQSKVAMITMRRTGAATWTAYSAVSA